MGAVRLSAISHFGVIYVMTHDSIGLGEDGVRIVNLQKNY